MTYILSLTAVTASPGVNKGKCNFPPQPIPLPQAGESEVLMRGGSGGKTESTLSGLYWSTTLMCIGSDQTDH